MSGFMNIPLLIFEKGDQQKNCVRVRKYTFLIFKKRGQDLQIYFFNVLKRW